MERSCSIFGLAIGKRYSLERRLSRTAILRSDYSVTSSSLRDKGLRLIRLFSGTHESRTLRREHEAIR